MTAVGTIEVRTEQMTYGGAALARHEGRVLFIPYALPDERVRVRIVRGKKRWAEAELLAVLEPSADRVEPRCPHFGVHRCGGCQWQHARYEAQLRYKTEIVREQLTRIGKIEAAPVRPCLGMAEPWAYRNNVQLHPSPHGPGFVRADRQGIFPLDVCFIMNPAIYELFEAVAGDLLPGVERLHLRGSARTGERLAVVEGEGEVPPLPDDVTVVGEGRRAEPAAAYHEQALGRRWRIRHDSFFQVNTEQAETLFRVVEEMAGPLRGDEVLLDSYAGGGFFGLSLAERVGHTFLLESHPAAAADARHHAAARPDVTVLEGTSEELLPRWEEIAPPPHLVLLDPPRAGCAPEVLQALGILHVPTIIYISCDPATQARDLRALLEQGYRLEVVQPVDLFPQTFHIEAVALLRWPKSG